MPIKIGNASHPKTHPRNRHQGHYDFTALVKCYPELAPFVAKTPYGELSIDFSHPEAVKLLNRALLMHYYGITKWEMPPDYLCPPIPGRADYIHSVADLLGTANGTIPRGELIRVLDIGVGASCIYPIIGNSEYGWKFVGTDVDPVALASAKRIVKANPKLSNSIEFRLQESPSNILEGVIQVSDRFHLTVCNPPFHASLEEAQAGSRRKWKNLGMGPPPGKKAKQAPLLNFGGQSSELWCEGGEAEFVWRMIQDSAEFPKNCLWYSTLISKDSTLPGVYASLKKAEVSDCRTIEMAQGQKKSRIVAWTFLNQKQQAEWQKLS